MRQYVYLIRSFRSSRKSNREKHCWREVKKENTRKRTKRESVRERSASSNIQSMVFRNASDGVSLHTLKSYMHLNVALKPPGLVSRCEAFRLAFFISLFLDIHTWSAYNEGHFLTFMFPKVSQRASRNSQPYTFCYVTMQYVDMTSWLRWRGKGGGEQNRVYIQM